MPYFSIVVPFYNRSHLVLPLLESLNKQTFQDFEIVLVDDGSTDGFGEVKLPADMQLVVISQSNAGGGAARNAGILASNGRYIAFLDSDDFFLPNKLERFADEIEETGAKVLYSYARVDRGNDTWARKPDRGIGKGERFDEYALAARQPTQTSTLVVESNLAKSVLFDPKLKKFQDIDFCLRLARVDDAIAFVAEELSIWTDSVADGRVGNRRRPEQAEYFLYKHKQYLSEKALWGFRANIYSYELAAKNPLISIWWILVALLKGHISVKRGVHSAARALVPQRIYRKLIDGLLK